MWHFGSVRSLNSVRNLPWNLAMPTHIYVFYYLSRQKRCRDNWILRNFKNYFSKNKEKYTLVKKRNVFLNKRVIFVFLTIFNLISWRRSFPVLSTDIWFLFSLFFSYISVSERGRRKNTNSSLFIQIAKV